MPMTEEDYDKVHKNTRIVINALFAGLSVAIDGYEFRIGENHSGIAILMKLTKFSFGSDQNQDPEDLWVTCDFGFNQVLRLAQKLTDDEVSILAANITLNKTKGKKY